MPLDSRRTEVGSAVYANVLYPWFGADCTLAKGSGITGHVVRVMPHHGGTGGTGGAELALLFDQADCNGQHNAPLQLLLYALVISEERQSVAMHDREGLFGTYSAHPVLGQGTPAAISTTEAVRNGVNAGPEQSQPEAVKAGQVLGESGITISFTESTNGTARLLAPRRDFRIDAGAQLVLIQRPRPQTNGEPALENRAAAIPATPRPSSPPPPPPVMDETELCGINCTESLSAVHGTGASETASLSASLTSLGYSPKPYRPRSGFDHETTLSFLQKDQLLLTFDPHGLRTHTGDPWRSSTRRTIRAVLVDTATLHVQRVVNWQVEDEGQYLWKAGPGRVLVHRQGSLHLLGPDLHDLAVFSARGEVAWITTSPSGDKIAFALRHERHTREAHETIQRLAGVEPVEDLQIQLIDRAGTMLLSQQSDTAAPRPVLTDQHEVLVQAAGPQRWRLLEQNPTAEARRQVATLTSACPPQVSAPFAEDLFVVGCAREGGRWFRLLNSQGHPIVTSRASMEAIEQSAWAASGDVLIHLFTLAHASAEDAPRSADELTGEQLEVRRERDGKLLLNVLERQFPPSRDSFALSPDGHWLASLTQTTLELRAVPPA